MTRRGAALAAIVLCVGLALTTSSVQAEERLFLALSPSEARVGERIIVRLEGWTATAVTLNICGNLGLRGAPDCDLIGGQGVGLASAGPTLAELEVSAPPVSCPCIVRASSSTNDEVQTTPLVIAGAPVAPVRQPGAATPLVTVTARASEIRQGLLGAVRPLLGGRRHHRLTITLQNSSTVTLSKVSLGLVTGKGLTGPRPVPAPAVLPLQPGEIRSYQVTTTRAAPTWGQDVWEVTADGAGPEVSVTLRTSATPWLLYLLLVALIADVGAFAVLKVVRRRRLRTARSRGRVARTGRWPRP